MHFFRYLDLYSIKQICLKPVLNQRLYRQYAQYLLKDERNPQTPLYLIVRQETIGYVLCWLDVLLVIEHRQYSQRDRITQAHL